jgi:molybdopterin molybdotransferase
MPVEEAKAKILATVKPLADFRMVSVYEALGLILAEDQIAQTSVPPADNSAMDGYVIRYADLSDGDTTTLSISQRIPAGAAPQPLVEGTAARIFTGAEVPSNADTVVMQEDCTVEGDNITFPNNEIAKQGQHVRPRGQDLAEGATVLPAGRRLLPQDLGVLASVGIAEVKVARPVKVAILSTGDELVEPGGELGPGQIYNSNRAMLVGLLRGLNIEPVDVGFVEDTLEATKAALIKAAEQADVIMTTGGVSVGEEDHVKPAVEALGSLNLWKMAIKPGKPLAYGEVQGTPIFGLPGNPASAFVTFLVVAREYLLAMQGAKELEPLAVTAQANFALKKAGKRKEYFRARLTVDEQGRNQVNLFDNQSSGVLSSASWGNGLAVVEMDQLVQPGDPVAFIPFASLLG